MSSQFGQQTGTQAPKGMGVIDLDVELFSQLTIDGLDNLADRVKSAADGFGGLVGLVAPGQGSELEEIVVEQLASHFSADVALVAKHGQVGILSQQFSTDGQVSSTSRGQLKIQNDPAQTDQHMQLETKDGELLAGDFAKISAMRGPVACRARHQMKLGDWYWQGVNGRLSIRTQIQRSQYRLPDDVESCHQRPTPTVKAALCRNMRKQIALLTPLTPQRPCQPLAGTAR